MKAKLSLLLGLTLFLLIPRTLTAHVDEDTSTRLNAQLKLTAEEAQAAADEARAENQTPRGNGAL